MQIKLLDARENPEETVVKCARNDYMEEWIGDKSFSEVVKDISKRPEAEEFYRNVHNLDELDQVTEEEILKTSLILKLMEDRHYGPFEHPHATFAVKGVSRVLLAQLTRHRIGISYDVQSQRYVDLGKKDLVMPPSIKEEEYHGPDGEVGEGVKELFIRQQETEKAVFKELRKLNVPKEDARFIRGQGTPVNITFTANARTLMHIFDMRLAGDAQWEIRNMCEEVLKLCKEWMPLTFTYYDENLRNRKNRLAP